MKITRYEPNVKVSFDGERLKFNSKRQTMKTTNLKPFGENVDDFKAAEWDDTTSYGE